VAEHQEFDFENEAFDVSIEVRGRSISAAAGAAAFWLLRKSGNFVHDNVVPIVVTGGLTLAPMGFAKWWDRPKSINPPKDTYEVTPGPVAFDIRGDNDSMGVLGFYGMGRSLDEEIGPDGRAILTSDTRVNIIYPHASQLVPKWDGKGVVVSRHDPKTDEVLPIKSSDISLEVIMGGFCPTKGGDKEGYKEFDCKTTLDEDGARTNISGRSGLRPGSGNNIVSDAIESARLVLTDRACFERLLQEVGGDPDITFDYVVRSSVRRTLANQYNIPPSAVTFDFSFASLAPIDLSKRFASASQGRPSLIDPFAGDSYDNWCMASATDDNGDLHKFYDESSMEAFVETIKKLGPENVNHGVWPKRNKKTGVVIDLDRDIRMALAMSSNPLITKDRIQL
jgi:hypothetical protein